MDKGDKDEVPMINRAAEIAIESLVKAEAMYYGLNVIARGIQTSGDRYRDLTPEERSAVTVLGNTLLRQTAECWSRICWLSPVSQKLKEVIARRTKDWVADTGNDIMSWLGKPGAYLASEEQSFRDEMLRVFDCGER
jgi:hypothetical protein